MSEFLVKTSVRDSFPVEKIEIIRTVQYRKPEDGVIHLPKGIKLYKIPGTERTDKFEGKKYTFCDYAQVVDWNPERELISHNLQIITSDESTDYPVLNSTCYRVYNVFNRFLVYHIKGIAAKEGEVIPETDQFPQTPIHFYFKKTVEDDTVMDQIMEYIKNTPKGQYSSDVVVELGKKLENTYAYYEVHNVVIYGDEPMFDATVININTDGTMSISKDYVPLNEIENNPFMETIHRTKEIDLKEFEDAYNKTLRKIIYR